jgi:hypothetical protein
MPNEPRKAPSSSDGFIQRINYGQVARLLFIQLRRPRRGLEREKRAAENLFLAILQSSIVHGPHNPPLTC